jgi:small subunit ribosomal protein S3
MSVIKRVIEDSKQRMQVDELLAEEYESAGYGGITLTKTPLGAQINLYTMRPGRVIGKRGRSIKAASARLEEELGLDNPQITVIEIEVPEHNPRIMAARIANALQRGVHYRRAIFWSLRRIMDSGALGCEIVLKGPLRSNRGRYEKVSEGYIPKSGEPSERFVKHATIHVKMKRGTVGVNVTIVTPEAEFPDKISLENLPEIEYTEEQIRKYEGLEIDEIGEIEGETPLIEPDSDITELPPTTTPESVPPDPTPTEEIEEIEETEPVLEEVEIEEPLPTDTAEVEDTIEEQVDVVPTNEETSQPLSEEAEIDELEEMETSEESDNKVSKIEEDQVVKEDLEAQSEDRKNKDDAETQVEEE